MTLRKRIKQLAEYLPYPVGNIFAAVPFSWRLGSAYTKYSAQAKRSASWSEVEREQYALAQFRRIYEYARTHFDCYRELYRDAGLADFKITSVQDIKELPVTTKAFFREHIGEFSGTYKLNTGGTTGSPFSFFSDRQCWAREWAHMHWIWKLADYNYREITLSMRGKNFGKKNIVYNPVHHEFLLNTYKPLSAFSNQFLKLIDNHEISFIHGYPSAVYNFICEAEKNYSQEELTKIFSPIRGVLLHSEFPLPYMKEKFAAYSLKCISWYGHSEMCVLAYDKDFDNHYAPMPTYGFAEEQNGHLLGTSFHNFDMPLIRYDTEDRITPTQVTTSGILMEFAIAEGRNGDFIVDKDGKQIPLTSLIFGRHHHAFDFADHIQIRQEKPGAATLLVVSSKPLNARIDELFDVKNVNVDFKMEIISSPILTPAGKLRLKVS